MNILMARTPEIEEMIITTVEQQSSPIVYMPIGILQLGSYIRNKTDTNVEYFDFEYAMNKRKFLSQTQYDAELKLLVQDTIKKFNPDIVALSCTTNIYHTMFHRVAKLIKEIDSNIITVGGGPYPSSYTQRVADDVNIDYVIVGEGELPFIDLIEACKQNNLPKNKVINMRQYIDDFTKFPLLDYDKIGIDNYAYDLGIGLDNSKSVSIVSSRGCPNRCIYCSTHNVWDYKFRARTAEQMVDEIEYLNKKYQITRFMYVEDNFIIDRKRIIEFCDLIIKRNIKVEWYPSSIQVNSLDCELIQHMAQAGCKKLVLAVESGVKRVQSLIRKNVKLEKVPEIVECIKNSGMTCECLLIFGFPGETKAEMEETVKYAQNLKCNWYQMGIATPLFGTFMYEMCEELGYLPPIEKGRILAFRTGLIETPDFTRKETEQIMWDANYRLNFLENNDFINGTPEIHGKLQIYFESIANRYDTHFISRYMLLQMYKNTNQIEKINQVTSELKNIYNNDMKGTKHLIEKYNLKVDGIEYGS